MKKRIAGALILGLAVIPAGIALADTSQFGQTISGGTLATFIGDASGVVVGSPSVSFTAKTISNAVQTSTGTYGSNTQRIYVDNPGGADNGWTLALAATSGPTGTWTSGSDTYPFNAASSGLGQLTVDATPGTITAEVGTTTGITKGSPSTFSGGLNTPANLLTAATGADNINRVYLTGVSASQTIPASTPAGSYTINFTQTVTAT